MNGNGDEDEFVAVRVQDPRVQNEGSWNSYVDYKIFLHTNSKAFTAKTSCVRRRYSEFVWLRKKMQKNAGLVPVPDLPGKSFFSFSGEDFLERRRKGLQAFLEKVVNTTVCLSDSQLHLFLQTQLPIGHIQDCVQGHTPYSVTDAILTYASSNRGLAQAQEEDAVRDSSLTVSYESMESPALHPPCPQTNEAFSPELLPGGDLDPLEGFLELRDQDCESQPTAKSSVRISQRSNHLEAVLEALGPARFYLGESLDDTRGLGPEEAIQHGSQIQTPVVVHSAVGGGLEECVDGAFEDESDGALDSAHLDSREEVQHEKFDGSIEILAFKDDTCEDEVMESDAAAPDGGEAAGDVWLERLVLENHTSAGDEAQTKEEQLQVQYSSRHQTESDTSPSEGTCDEDAAAETLEDSLGTDEDSQSLPSSSGSIVKVSDEEEEQESACEEDDLSIQTASGLVKLPDVWSEVEASGLDLQVNGSAVGKQDEDVSSAVADGDLTENSDISILESSSVPGLTDASPYLDAAQQQQDASPYLDAAQQQQDASPYLDAAQQQQDASPYLDAAQQQQDASPYLDAAQQQQDASPYLDAAQQQQDASPYLDAAQQQQDASPYLDAAHLQQDGEAL